MRMKEKVLRASASKTMITSKTNKQIYRINTTLYITYTFEIHEVIPYNKQNSQGSHSTRPTLALLVFMSPRNKSIKI
jgi:hypothetical protein